MTSVLSCPTAPHMLSQDGTSTSVASSSPIPSATEPSHQAESAPSSDFHTKRDLDPIHHISKETAASAKSVVASIKTSAQLAYFTEQAHETWREVFGDQKTESILPSAGKYDKSDISAEFRRAVGGFRESVVSEIGGSSFNFKGMFKGVAAERINHQIEALRSQVDEYERAGQRSDGSSNNHSDGAVSTISRRSAVSTVSRLSKV